MALGAVVGGPRTALAFQGRFGLGIRRWAYLPFDVPPGVRRVSVSCSYDRFPRFGAVAGNVLDLGIFGPPGSGPPGSGPPGGAPAASGFRGWSGGARDRFTISETDATPGYLPGPIEPGRWRIALGPVVLNPFGMRWQVRVELEYGPQAGTAVADCPPPSAIAGRGPGWYRGDLHLHSVHSDGDRTLDGLAAEARAAGLDFIASTEHNTCAANRVWGGQRLDGLLVVPGEEVTTRHGHWLAVGLAPDGWIDWRHTPRSGDFARLAAVVRERGGLVVAAHPSVPVPSSAWTFGYRDVDAIEVWNGVWNADDEVSLRIWHALLRRGRRIVAVGGSDSHAAHQPVGRPHTVAYAAALSTPAVLAGLRAGRSYLAASTGTTVDLTARLDDAHGSAGPDDVAGPGQILALPPGAAATVRVSVGGAPHSRVSLITAAGAVAHADLGGAGTGTVEWAVTGQPRFVRVEVRRAGLGPFRSRMVALSNPVWIAPG